MIDFMLIVLNGEPWINAWLKTYEPYANKIHIIEGTDNEMFHNVPHDIRKLYHTEDGHSTDNTLEIIKTYNTNKIKLYNINPKTGNGLWHSKHQMIAQINDKIETEWLWEADSDEFVHDGHIKEIIKVLKEYPKNQVWQFKVYNFWKSLTHILQGGWVTPYRRIFKWEPGKTRWTTHRPPTTNNDASPKTIPYPLYHYNYILEKDAKYKPLYHRGYGKQWFEQKWKAWTPKSKEQIEKNSIGPASWGHTTTKYVNQKHPIYVKPILAQLLKKGMIMP